MDGDGTRTHGHESQGWETCPESFKILVVHKLDYRAKCCLQKCSRPDRQLLQSIPLNTSKAILSIAKTWARLQVDNLFIESEHHKLLETAIRDFLLLFQNPESKFGEITFQYLEGLDNDRIIQVNRLLEDAFQVFPQSFHIMTESLYYGFSSDQKQFMAVLQNFKPGYLKHIRIKTLELKKVEWQAVTETEQWNCAKSMNIEIKNPVPICNFLRFETFYTIVTELTPGEAASIIENYVAIPRPRGSYFYVLSHTDLDFGEILKLGNFESRNEPVATPWKPHVVLHTQRLQLTEGVVLVVIFMQNEITGRICHLDSLEEDCREFYTQYFPNY